MTVPTREVANYVQTRFGVKNTAILPWGIDEDVFYPRRKDEILAVRKQLALPDKAKVVLSPRNLTPLYNIDAIIGAIPRVLQVNSEVVFCFLRGTGSVAYEAKLMDRAAELGVKENTRWIQDFQTSEEMARLFSVDRKSVV